MSAGNRLGARRMEDRETKGERESLRPMTRHKCHLRVLLGGLVLTGGNGNSFDRSTRLGTVTRLPCE